MTTAPPIRGPVPLSQPMPTREAIDTALHLLEQPNQDGRSSGMRQLVDLLMDPSFRADPVLEEKLSSLLQTLIGHVGQLQDAPGEEMAPTGMHAVNALGCLLTGPSLAQSSLAPAGTAPRGTHTLQLSFLSR